MTNRYWLMVYSQNTQHIFSYKYYQTTFLRHSYHMRNVIQTCELIEADAKMPQLCEAGNLLYFIQTVAMKVQHLNI